MVTTEVEPQAAGGERAGGDVGVQPCGFLLGLTRDWRVGRVSANLAQHLGLEAAEALGQAISSLLTPTAVHSIRNRVALLREDDSPERMFDQTLTSGGAAFDVSLRVSGDEVILEAVAGTDSGGIDVAGAVGRMARRLESASDVETLAASASRELRGLTGFDSIQLFESRGASPVRVAGCVRSGARAFEPTSAPAAALRRAHWIADTRSGTIPVLCPRPDRRTTSAALLAPLDAGLNESLINAGARSAILLPIPAIDGTWGFALALHRAARPPRLARLSAAELFAHLVGLRIDALQPRRQGDQRDS